jgi:hypothetical protein
MCLSECLVAQISLDSAAAGLEESEPLKESPPPPLRLVHLLKSPSYTTARTPVFSRRRLVVGVVRCRCIFRETQSSSSVSMCVCVCGSPVGVNGGCKGKTPLLSPSHPTLFCRSGRESHWRIKLRMKNNKQ